MHRDEFDSFSKLLEQLAVVYGKELNDVILQAYWKALRDLSLAQLQSFAETHLKRGKFFPKPSELRPKEERTPYEADGKSKAADDRCIRNLEELRRLDPPRWEWEVSLRRADRVIARADFNSEEYQCALLHRDEAMRALA